jgi:amidophosphoribosyltransferase
LLTKQRHQVVEPNSDAFKDECGVFGIWNHPEAARLTYLGLYAMQHRGQESAGIVTLSKERHLYQKGLGLVQDVFSEQVLSELVGPAAIGHVRYSTTGGNILGNAQPLMAELLNGPVAVAHNGNIVNAEPLRLQLKELGSIFQGTNDTEVILHMIARHPSSDLQKCLLSTLEQLEGAYSLTVLSRDNLFACRDAYGFRPLVLGRIPHAGGQATVIASETSAFDLIGATFEREIEPGEIFWIDKNGEHSQKMTASLQKTKGRKAQCVFEHVYFARPDSVVFGRSVYQTRKNAGRILARESSVPADIVVPVPDSGVPAAIGYAQASSLPFELGIIRNHYVGRTFIEPQQSIRSFGVKVKLNPQASVLKNKRVILVDDSIVRGTTSQKIVGLVRAAGASEVHLRIAAPPTTGPCYYGVDTPEKSQLIASHQTLQEICDFVGADSLSYLSVEGLFEAVNGQEKEFCAACFDGHYPTSLFGLDQQEGAK